MNNHSVFSVSSVLTLFFAQSIALQRRSIGNQCKLVLWSFKNDPAIFQAFHQVLVPELWSVVIELPHQLNETYTRKNLPLKRKGMLGNFSAIRDSENILKEKWRLIGRASELFICSNNPIDFGLYSHCPHSPKLCYIEDGLQAYFTSHYSDLNTKIRAAPSKKLISLLLPKLRSLIMSICSLKAEPLVSTGLFSYNYDYGEIYAIFPEKVKAAPARSLGVSLKSFLTHKTIKTLENAVPQFSLPKEKISNLYLSRPDSEDELCSLEQEVENTVRFINAIYKVTNKIVWLKTHPRDSQKKIKLILAGSPHVKLLNLDFPYPIELIARRLEIDRVYSLWTASLVYLNLFFGIKTFSFLPSLISNLHETENPYLAIYNEISPITESTIKWIDLCKKQNTPNFDR